MTRTGAEEAIDLRTRQYRFDIWRLGPRVSAAADWARRQPAFRELPIGCFGASTGAAAALIAAAERPETMSAVFSRGGRPDLAGPALVRVEAPTLLIVGGDDEVVIGMNRDAMRQMHAYVQLEIIPGATHLFQEPGALEQVERLAASWFGQVLAPRWCGASALTGSYRSSECNMWPIFGSQIGNVGRNVVGNRLCVQLISAAVNDADGRLCGGDMAFAGPIVVR